MIISHAKKFAFFRIPKTGSTTTEFMLRMTGAFTDPTDILTGIMVGGFTNKNISSDSPPDIKLEPGRHLHLTPEAAVEHGYITQAQLEEYDCFATLREPLSRHLSIFFHAVRIADPMLFRAGLENHTDYGLLERRSTKYFFSNGVPVCRPLDFDNIVPETRRLLALVGADTFPVIPNMNPARAQLPDGVTRDDYWDEGLIELARRKYAEDLVLYDRLMSSHNCRRIG